MSIRDKEIEKYVERYKILQEACCMLARGNEGDTTAIVFIMNINDKGDELEICYTTPKAPRELKYLFVRKERMAEMYNVLENHSKIKMN